MYSHWFAQLFVRLIKQLNKEAAFSLWLTPEFTRENKAPCCDSDDSLLFPPDPVTTMSYGSSHLDRVADDYFSRDPVSDTISVREQPLKVAVWSWPLTCKPTAPLCWWNMLRHISVGRAWDVGKSSLDFTALSKRPAKIPCIKEHL